MEKTIVLSVEGMSCEHCVRAVTNALKAISGVKKVEVSLEKKKAQVVYDDELTPLSALESAILEEGFKTSGVID